MLKFAKLRAFRLVNLKLHITVNFLRNQNSHTCCNGEFNGGQTLCGVIRPTTLSA